jgi:hypothetical protein
MPPAFNLSQDQTLQFNACYCFLFLRIGRSLNVLTSSSHLPVARKTLKTYLNTSVRLDTFASVPDPKVQYRDRTPSAHTYRLLVFKEHSLKSSAPTSQPRRFLIYRVAACAAEKRDYVAHFVFRQQFFYRFVTPASRPTGLACRPLIPVLPGFRTYRDRSKHPALLTSLRLVLKRRGRILVTLLHARKDYFLYTVSTL